MGLDTDDRGDFTEERLEGVGNKPKRSYVKVVFLSLGAMFVLIVGGVIIFISIPKESEENESATYNYIQEDQNHLSEIALLSSQKNDNDSSQD